MTSRVMRDKIITHRSLHVAIGACYFLSRTLNIGGGGIIIVTSGSGNPHREHVLRRTYFSWHSTADIFKHVKNVQENSRFSYQRQSLERLVKLARTLLYLTRLHPTTKMSLERAIYGNISDKLKEDNPEMTDMYM